MTARQGHWRGVEITQAIQYFRPPVTLSAVAGRTGIQPENEMPLVAKKPSVLRVYFQDISDVTGTVEWRVAGTTAWSPAQSSLTGPLARASSYPLTSRAALNESLNFRLPAAA